MGRRRFGERSHTGLPIVSDAAILAFLDEYIQAHGYPPSLRDLCARFVWTTTNAASQRLKRLERLGYIRRTPMTSRGMIVLKKAGQNVKAKVRVICDAVTGRLKRIELNGVTLMAGCSTEAFGRSTSNPLEQSTRSFEVDEAAIVEGLRRDPSEAPFFEVVGDASS